MTSNEDINSGAKNTELAEEEQSRRDRKAQKRIEKTLEQTLAAAGEIAEPPQRLSFVCRKHAEAVEENKRLTSTLRKLELRVDQLLKEKMSLESEQSKALLTRSRLEGLCRELQKQNKLIKEESVAKIREEEEKRREVSAKFQTTLSDITGTMNENNQKNSRLTEENIEMSKKLKSLCEQYEQNNSLVEKMMKQKELESQLAEARLAKLQLEMNEEKREFLQEKQKLLTEMSAYQKRCTDLQKSEVVLREQLGTYTEKYEDFQGALAKSNKVFGTFKSEMEKMQKNIRRLEKETGSWRARWEGSNRSLLRMAEQKQADDARLLAQSRRLETLQRLCRALQARAAGSGAASAAAGELAGLPADSTAFGADEELQAACDAHRLAATETSGGATSPTAATSEDRMSVTTSALSDVSTSTTSGGADSMTAETPHGATLATAATPSDAGPAAAATSGTADLEAITTSGRADEATAATSTRVEIPSSSSEGVPSPLHCSSSSDAVEPPLTESSAVPADRASSPAPSGLLHSSPDSEVSSSQQGAPRCPRLYRGLPPLGPCRRLPG